MTQDPTRTIGIWLSACVLICGGFFSPLWSQSPNIPRVNVFMDYAEMSGIDAEEKRQYADIVRDKLSQLVYASSFGKSNGTWDLDRYLVFGRLFTNDALITNFLQLKPSVMAAYQFLAIADERVNPKAINFKHKTAVMRSMRKNPSGDIEVNLQLDWELYSYFDKNGNLVESVKARPTTLNVQLLIEPTNANNAVFLRMTGEITSSLSNDLSSLSVAAGYTFGSLSTLNDFGFSNVTPRASGLGLQLHYLKNMDAGQKWFLWGGLQASILSFKTDFTGKASADVNLDAATLDSAITRIGINNSSGKLDTSKITGILFATATGSNKSAAETMRNSFVLQAVLGVQRRWPINNKLDFYTGVALFPQYLFSNSNGTLNIEGYQLPADKDNKKVTPNFPDYAEISNQGISSFYELSDDLILDGIEHKANFSLNTMFKGSLRRALGFGWGLELAAQYQLGLSNMFSYSGGPSINFPGNRKEKKTLLEDYAPNTRFRGWGLSLGLFFEFGTKY